MDPGPIKVPCIEVSHDEAEEFIEALEVQLNEMTPAERKEVYLLLKERRALAISFSGQWQPFLGFTPGFNLPAQRSYLPEGITVLDHVIDLLSAWRLKRPGGRVFINMDTAQKVIGEQLLTICIWDWAGDDPVGKVKMMLRKNWQGE